MSLSLFIHKSNRKMHPYIFKSLLYLMLDLHCLFCSDKKKPTIQNVSVFWFTRWFGIQGTAFSIFNVL